MLGSDMGDHPLDPVRLELTIALARLLGVLERPTVRVVAAEPADDELLTLVHQPEYIAAVTIPCSPTCTRPARAWWGPR